MEKKISAADSQLVILNSDLKGLENPSVGRILVALHSSVPVLGLAMQPHASSDQCAVPRPHFPPPACTRDLIALSRYYFWTYVVLEKFSSF